ncbi:hypothetical protein LC608_32505 [Nostoc sp. XA010]|uniref:hypothetical protein n=1 Tax=Nostoc sp. XA010 TaxID=2780407 RepID=UPI001E3A51D9|nr:hypothetical protein [Nostoc sp. XA010]MCC5661587.1 hypothetical protein [Nostoc sp. XA010]
MPSASFSTRRYANANAELQEFIGTCRDAREARKALAVKMNALLLLPQIATLFAI